MTTTADQAVLASSPYFKNLPEQVQSWFLNSATASAQFAQFFRDGGKLNPSPLELYASYRQQDPATKLPVIDIKDKYYPLTGFGGDSNPINAERQIFTMVSHEIGHHAINSTTHPFTGTTREQNMLYRAEHEALTMVNSFKIFYELQRKDPDFRPDYGRVGYGSDIQVGAEYALWKKDHNDEAAVKRLTGIVLMTPDSRTAKGLDNVPDLNGDGHLTHADRYLRDWDDMQKRKESAPRMRAPGGRSSDLDQDDQETRRTQDLNQGDVAVEARVDPLLGAIWAELPQGTSREKAEEVKLAAKLNGIERVEQFRDIHYRDGDPHAYVQGYFEGFKARVDLSVQAPTLEATREREQAHDKEQTLIKQQFEEQQARLNQEGPHLARGGMRMRSSASGPDFAAAQGADSGGGEG